MKVMVTTPATVPPEAHHPKSSQRESLPKTLEQSLNLVAQIPLHGKVQI